MPEYEHSCQNETCYHEWCETYSIKADPPKLCPKCGQETAKRVISGGSGRGIVELTGNDLTDKVKADVAQMKRDLPTNERMYSNMVGENRYQELQTSLDKGKRFRR